MDRVRGIGEKAAGLGKQGKKVNFGEPRSSCHELFGGIVPRTRERREDAGTGTNKSGAFESLDWDTV